VRAWFAWCLRGCCCSTPALFTCVRARDDCSPSGTTSKAGQATCDVRAPLLSTYAFARPTSFLWRDSEMHTRTLRRRSIRLQALPGKLLSRFCEVCLLLTSIACACRSDSTQVTRGKAGASRVRMGRSPQRLAWPFAALAASARQATPTTPPVSSVRPDRLASLAQPVAHYACLAPLPAKKESRSARACHLCCFVAPAWRSPHHASAFALFLSVPALAASS
jgi:hypothetical protein